MFTKEKFKVFIRYSLTVFIYLLILSSIGIFGSSLQSKILPIILFSLKWCLIIFGLFFIFFIEIRIKQAINLNEKRKEDIKNKIENEKKIQNTLEKDKRKVKKYKFNEDNI